MSAARTVVVQVAVMASIQVEPASVPVPMLWIRASGELEVGEPVDGAPGAVADAGVRRRR